MSDWEFKPEDLMGISMARPGKNTVTHFGLERFQAERLCEVINARVAPLLEALRRIKVYVDDQAEDEGLWSVPAEGTQRIAEAYLQQELRALHKTIEDSFVWALGEE